jgi:hypothetical protein
MAKTPTMTAAIQSARALRQKHRGADDDGGKGDACLDAGEGEARDAEGAAERHHQREGHRQQPDRRGSEEGAPEADGNHRRDMVPAGDRMLEAAQEAGAGDVAGVGGSDGAGEQERAGKREEASHPAGVYQIGEA